MNIQTLSISQLNTYIKDVIDAGIPRNFWLCGEISGLDRYKSGAHLFFDLVEKEEQGKTVKAKIGVAIWAGIRVKIEHILKRSENAFELKDGIEVKLLGKVDFYPPYGTLRFVVEAIDPVHTLGKLAQERQKLIAELEKSGVLLKNKQLNIPQVPLRIGLISSFDSAAYNDFLHELKKQSYGFNISFVKAVMQGKNCTQSICEAIEKLQRVEGLDLIVITRGGGAITELAAFDAKEIAIAISCSKYPIVTGIGHEINLTIADLAAHSFFKTPTATASFLNERITEFLDRLFEAHLKMMNISQEVLRQKRISLKNVALKLQSSTMSCFSSSKEKTVLLTERANAVVQNLLKKEQQHLEQQKGLLKQTICLRFDKTQVKITNLEKIVSFASPQKIFKRGFSITRTSNGAIVRSFETVKQGDTLISQFADGTVSSIVDKS